MATIFIDHISQPSRAVAIFCRCNRLPVQEKLVNIGKGQTRAPEFKAINPLGKVPCFKDGSLVLIESASILRYLSATSPVSNDWYPSNPAERASVDAVLDWYNATLRFGCARLTFIRVITGVVGTTAMGSLGDEHVANHAEAMLKQALQELEGYWLAQTPFMSRESISIADLLNCCELEQLRLLDAALTGPNMTQLLQPFPRVRAWMARVAQETSPHYQDLHVALGRLLRHALRLKEKKLRDLAAPSKL